MHDGERLRNAEVVVHRIGEGLGNERLDGSDLAQATLREALDAVERARGLGERLLGNVEVRAIVRGGERVTDHAGRVLLEKIGRENEVAERFRHLLPAGIHQTVVQPVPSKSVTRGRGLRELVLVVREAQIESATVDVELIAERTDDKLEVRVRDSGVGLPKGRVGQGLGTQIVRTLIEGELSGTIEWHGTEGAGTEVTIDIPLRYIERPKN